MKKARYSCHKPANNGNNSWLLAESAPGGRRMSNTRMVIAIAKTASLKNTSRSRARRFCGVLSCFSSFEAVGWSLPIVRLRSPWLSVDLGSFSLGADRYWIASRKSTSTSSKFGYDRLLVTTMISCLSGAYMAIAVEPINSPTCPTSS